MSVTSFSAETEQTDVGLSIRAKGMVFAILCLYMVYFQAGYGRLLVSLVVRLGAAKRLRVLLAVQPSRFVREARREDSGNW